MGELEATLVTDTEENDFLNGIEISHKLVIEEAAGFPTTGIILVVAGVFSALVSFYAVRRRH